MRRNRVDRRLHGQLVRVEGDPEGIVVDCLMGTRVGDTLLVTLSLSVGMPSLPRVLDVLETWEQCAAGVDVLIVDGPLGPQVEMSAGNRKLVLTPRD